LIAEPEDRRREVHRPTLAPVAPLGGKRIHNPYFSSLR
jgi:hypothetical protein